MATYLITGASRGIGLELTKQLLELPSSQVGKVFALARNINSGPIQELAKEHSGRLVLVSAAVDDTSSVQSAAETVKAELNGKGLDVLINNAGISGEGKEKVEDVTPEDLSRVFDVNVGGPQRVIVAFLPLLEAGSQKKVINISSALGSIAWAPKTATMPAHSYIISKAALNMLNARYAVKFADAGFTFLLISPGWLKTDMGTEHADLDVQVGVADVKRIILESGKEQNGKFLTIRVPGWEQSWSQYDGGEVPW